MSYHGPVIYDHDCKNCTYLGSFFSEPDVLDLKDRENFSNKKIYDLYICLNSRDRILSSLLARYSSVGGDYSSFPVDIFISVGSNGRFPLTTEVYRRAKEDGLL